MSNYPPGCTQAIHDRYYNAQPEPEVMLDCGHMGNLDTCPSIDTHFICAGCEETAEILAGQFEGLELSALIEALKLYGPARLGNHDLFRRLAKKLELADAWQKREQTREAFATLRRSLGSSQPAPIKGEAA